MAGLPEVRPGDDLGRLIGDAAEGELRHGDVVVVAHKVVSKAEGRVRRLAEIEPGAEARRLAALQRKDPRLLQAVLDETVRVVRESERVLICETPHGFVCANAGVDRSNTGGADDVVLLPDDPDASARALRAKLDVRPAVVVADSFGRPWRLGQTDVALGMAGLTPLDDWRGRTDSGGRPLEATAIAVADAATAAADLARSKDSREPVVLVRGLERFVTAADGPGAAALRRPPGEDLFR